MDAPYLEKIKLFPNQGQTADNQPMPKVKFTPPVTDWDAITLIAIRHWPTDEAKQLNLLRACFPKFLAIQQQTNPESYATKESWDRVNYLCGALGGWEAIADAPRYSEFKEEIAGLSESGAITGIALVLAEQLISQGVSPEYVSLNRMAYLLGEFGEHLIGKSIPEDTFMRAWINFKPVAHLWAGFLTGSGLWDGGHLHDPLEPLSGLGQQFERSMLNQFLYSQQFYRFGTSYRPPKGRSTILDPSTAYELEAEVEGDPFKLAPLHPVLIEALKAYPKTKH
ncbi:hypothetical protein [Geothrix terrae]|uniref:hypothetical protein n=1 Tax=Geothrix terrae TaxID=2922720 RepID=UPI001FAD66C1|nr:hypothetical protein [Geothrix terrae]